MQRLNLSVKVDDLGRVTIPKIFRDFLGIERGETLACYINEAGNIEYFRVNQKETETHEK